MSEIRIVNENEYPEVIRIAVEAYPSMGVNTREGLRSWEQRFKNMMRDKDWTPYGVFRDGKMVGIYRNFDFTMNVRGNLVPAGGLGMVAVDLTHKKEHIAKEIVESFLGHYHGKSFPMTTLWPFRIDFYHQMGFGLGGRRYQYRIDPKTLPRGKSKEHIRYLTEDDLPLLVDCYNRFFEKQNGMLRHSEARWKNRFEFMEKIRYIGCVIDGRLEGYLTYTFKTPANPGSFMDSEMVVNELFYHTPQALSELLSFLHSQFDQVSVLTLETSEDEFYFIPSIPAMATGTKQAPTFHDSHMSGLGIMYRVMDLGWLFGALHKPSFGTDRLNVKINLRDTFLPANNCARVVHFEGGLGRVVENEPAEVAISLDVAEFSSMIMASASFRNLHTYGLATISDPSYIDRIDRLFAYGQRPMCVTPF